MRTAGVLEGSTGLGYHDHVCWAFADGDELAAEVRAFLAEGLRLGQRVGYVAPHPAEALRASLDGMAELDALVASGAVELHDVSAMYASGSALQADAYVEATWRAVADGYRGLRIAADATDLVVDPGDRHAFVRYEHVIDRLMADGLPFTALCAYDKRRLGPDAVDEVACVHPLTHGTGATFRLHAGDDADLVLAGEIDTLDECPLATALDRVLAGCGPSVTIDCTALDFIDHRGLIAIDRAATRAGVRVILRNVRQVVAWMAGILAFPSVEVAS